MFEDSTFESQGRIHTRSKRWMVATLAFNGSILGGLVLIPLVYPSMLPLQSMRFLVTTPEAPKGPPDLPHRANAPVTTSATRNIPDPFQIPPRIPPSIIITNDPGPGGEIAMGPEQGPGIGTPGGVGDDPFHHAPQHVVPAEPKSIRVSSGTEEGLIVFRTLPQYPIIARTAHIEGTVVLAATISSSGTIENLRVVSGPVMLQQAAIDAVKTWRYKPYMLDGLPVEVETSVNVVFRIQH